jgi:hypothetical protein
MDVFPAMVIDADDMNEVEALLLAPEVLATSWNTLTKQKLYNTISDK